jgi:hypothetical protein
MYNTTYFHTYGVGVSLSLLYTGKSLIIRHTYTYFIVFYGILSWVEAIEYCRRSLCGEKSCFCQSFIDCFAVLLSFMYPIKHISFFFFLFFFPRREEGGPPPRNHTKPKVQRRLKNGRVMLPTTPFNERKKYVG